MLENDVEFSCPYCGETLSLAMDSTGGRKQQFVTDCEVCCKPIVIRVEFEDGEVINFSAEAES